MIEPIESADDPRLDPYRHVGDPSWLRSHGLFLAEGRLVVERLLPLARYRVQSILLNPAAHAAMSGVLAGSGAPVLVCSDPALLGTITGYNFHRGCLALVQRPPDLGVDVLLGCRRVLALEGIGNPDNVGGLFRTAAAFGVDGVVLNGATGDPLYRKALRTSMGASLRVPYARTPEWLPALAGFRAAGFRILALTPSTDAVDVSRVEGMRNESRLLVMVGAEGPGLEPASLSNADVRVRIPIDASVDSLNVVVAAGIALERLRIPG